MPLSLIALSRIASLTICIAISVSLPRQSVADTDRVEIVAPILGENLLTQDENGFWADMFRQILTGLNQPHDLVALPLKRSLSAFSSDEFDCIWSLDRKTLDGLGVDVTGLLESKIVFEATQHVFVAPGHPMIASLEDLSGKRIGIGSGSSYEDPLKKASAKVVLLSDQVSKLRMLENDRIDAFIGWLPGLLIMDTDASLKSEILRNHLKLSSSGAVFVCHDTEKNNAFINRINPAIEAYRTSDRFTALFASYGASQMLEDEYR